MRRALPLRLERRIAFGIDSLVSLLVASLILRRRRDVHLAVAVDCGRRLRVDVRCRDQLLFCEKCELPPPRWQRRTGERVDPLAGRERSQPFVVRQNLTICRRRDLWLELIGADLWESKNSQKKKKKGQSHTGGDISHEQLDDEFTSSPSDTYTDLYFVNVACELLCNCFLFSVFFLFFLREQIFFKAFKCSPLATNVQKEPIWQIKV